MTKHFQFSVKAKLMDQAEMLDLGTLTLSDPAYSVNKSDLTEKEAASAALGELKYIKASNVYQWRSAIIPAANFGGLIVQLVSSWIDLNLES